MSLNSAFRMSDPRWARTLGAPLVLVMALLAPISAQGQIFSDTEARRALFDLRTQSEAWQKTVTQRLDEMQLRLSALRTDKLLHGQVGLPRSE